MATRAKPIEIVVESQKVFGVISKGLKWVGIVVGIATVVVVTIRSVHDLTPEEPRVISASAQSEKMILTMLAGGKSERIPVPPYMHVVMKGDNFRLHNVYRDGHECAFGEACTDGPLAAVYVTNEDTKNPNIVSYSYVPMK